MDFFLLLVLYAEIYIILSLSLNLIAGYTGLLSLCHAAFLGTGAYTTAILMKTAGFAFLPALLISMALAAIFGIIIGLPTLRLKGDYLAIATLGFNEIVKNILINWDGLTNGPRGIHSIPAVSLFSFTLNPFVSKIPFVILTGLFALFTYFFLRRIVRSRFGRALESIREDEIAASAMGINVTKYKIMSFTVGAMFAGAAGSLWTVFHLSVFPDQFEFMISVMILCMVVLGGLGNGIGAILGGIIIVTAWYMPQLLSGLKIITPEVRQIMFGLILVLMMIFRPQGILGRKKPDFEAVLKESVLSKIFRFGRSKAGDQQ
jgi:branched-chain amino acid transport system permease protein